jgi:D-3-phosphoglycerate dehydrogenase
VDEAALVDAVRSGRVAGAALDVFANEPPEGSPLFELPEVVLTPHLGASTVEAQDKAGTDVAASVVAALRGELVPDAVNLDLGRDVPDELIPFLPVAEHLAAVFVTLAQGLPSELSVRVEGRLAESNCKPLSLAALKSALSRVSAEQVTYVNALSLAETHGIALVEESTSVVSDYVSVIRLSGVVGAESYEVSGTLVGRKGPALVGALDHEIELPLSANTVLLLNDDVPGVIGHVGAYLGELGVNIANMVVGRSDRTGAAAAMGLNVDRPLSEQEVEGLRQVGGVKRAWFVDLS